MRGSPTDLLVLSLGETEPRRGYLQRFAGGFLWSARPLAADAVEAPQPALPAPPARAFWKPVYAGPGLVEGSLQRLTSALDSATGWRRVAFEGGELFLVSPDGRLVARGDAKEISNSRSLELALGGPVALALALRGVHLLHASAFEIAGRALALTAESGGGKSTLAAAAAHRGWARLADDQLPVQLGARSLALPHFPQLKVPNRERYPGSEPAEVPLLALVEIAHAPACRVATIDRLPRPEAALAMVRATVASRLFDPPLLASHFAGATAAAETLPVVRFRFPSGLDRLDPALDSLFEWAGALPRE